MCWLTFVGNIVLVFEYADTVLERSVRVIVFELKYASEALIGLDGRMVFQIDGHRQYSRSGFARQLQVGEFRLQISVHCASFDTTQH